MVSRFYAILLIVCFLMPAAFKALTVIQWRWNQTEITKTLCVNKNKPERKCHGKCRLSLLLKEYQKEHSPISNQERSELKPELSFYEMPVITFWIISPLDPSEIKALGTQHLNLHQLFIPNIFDPPECV